MLTGWPGATDAFPVVFVGGGEELAALAGGRVAARVDWGDDPSPAIGAAGTVVVADAGAVEEATLLAALPDLAAVAATWSLVVLFGAARLDLIAGALLPTEAQLLCDATLAEQVAAIAIAGHAVRADGVREGEAARLKRFSEEVARVAAVLARLAADEGAGDVADRRPSYDAGQVAIEPVVPVDARGVRRLLRARRLRDGFLGAGLFEDPAWDMLLDLFAAELEGAEVSVSSLCIAAAVAPTTALRWVGRLTDAGLFERRPDPQDRRRAFVGLSARGSAAMRGYFSSLGRAGLLG